MIAVSPIVMFGLMYLWTVDDVPYMLAMIPHHSIASMTSRRPHLQDPRVKALAEGIAKSQVREIAEMKTLITDLDRAH